MNGKVTRMLRGKALESYMKFKRQGRRMGTFKNYFRLIKELYMKGELV